MRKIISCISASPCCTFGREGLRKLRLYTNRRSPCRGCCKSPRRPSTIRPYSETPTNHRCNARPRTVESCCKPHSRISSLVASLAAPRELETTASLDIQPPGPTQPTLNPSGKRVSWHSSDIDVCVASMPSGRPPRRVSDIGMRISVTKWNANAFDLLSSSGSRKNSKKPFADLILLVN